MEKTRIIEYKYDENDIKTIRTKLIDFYIWLVIKIQRQK